MTSPLMEARGLKRNFGHVKALDGADFTLYPGEICAVVGDNGAGKSTLVKILSGADTADAGSIFLEGREVRFASPTAAQHEGIATVYQDLALAPELTPADNLYLGRELFKPGLLGKVGLLDRAEMRRRSAKQFRSLGVSLKSPQVPVVSLSGGQRQSVAIARAAMWADKVIFMDEPTAALGVVQTDRVLALIRSVRDSGIAVVLISHNMSQVVDIADRVEVFRLGRRVARFSKGQATVERLVTAMTSGGAQTEGTT